MMSVTDLSMPLRDRHPQADQVSAAINIWFEHSARELPWRPTTTKTVTPWAILVSEFMLQQTQASRVIDPFTTWLLRWPTPSALAADAPGEAVKAWGRLGYPRRALWLHRAATEIYLNHNDTVPDTVEELLRLTGVGPYTARAVTSFAYSRREPVVDTNTRRVLARLLFGKAAADVPRPRDLTDMEQLLPEDSSAARTFNAAAMELGATVCIARAPVCESCPVKQWCQWRGAGYPNNAPAKRKQAAFTGSDRQVRGKIMSLLRGSEQRLTKADLIEAALFGQRTELPQAERAIDSLINDGLLVLEHNEYRLP